MLKKILITGGAGFIGSSLANELSTSHKAQIAVFDDLSTGLKSNISKNENIIIRKVSIVDALTLRENFANFSPDFVIHAAASYNQPKNWNLDIETNIIGMSNLIKLSKEFSVKKFIYLQTSLCYGLDPKSSPVNIGDSYFKGGYHGGSSYAISKTTGELYLSLSGINFISFRLANVYGPRNFSGPIPAFYSNLMNNTKSRIYKTKRDFIYVGDVVSCIIKSLKKETSDNYFNISTGVDIEISEIYKLLEKELGKSKPFDLLEKDRDDTSTILLDSSKTKDVFDWEPRTSLKEGIRKTILYYNKHGIDNVYSHLKLNK
ncbi:NAD-dependent epimerase/dehydratase family protein [Flavobacteriales bacterium]|nr:NAD-dependent epimerase/dehydratase family protein [Flavobacteriales bacterium]